MRKPEITKKTSTPTYPPLTCGTPAWESTTSVTATARSPWMSNLSEWPPGGAVLPPAGMVRTSAGVVLGIRRNSLGD
ncbi:hypothetical protein GCM10010317_057430 [Streptomyces mirabilis]|nr:hypothetical protein GCM10010317_057430 [Streptomyces mirabilis]